MKVPWKEVAPASTVFLSIDWHLFLKSHSVAHTGILFKFVFVCKLRN